MGWWYDSGWGADYPNSSDSPAGYAQVFGATGMYNSVTLPPLMIEGWLNDDNYGLRLASDDESAAWDYITIRASNYAGSQPLLSIDYTLVKEIETCQDAIDTSGGLSGDLNEDCHVNLGDLAIFASHWLECTGPDCP